MKWLIVSSKNRAWRLKLWHFPVKYSKIYQTLNYKKTYFPILEAELSSRITSSTRFHDVTFKEMVMFILTAVRATNMIMMITKNSNNSSTLSTGYIYNNYSAQILKARPT
jgi:hypothetical protein